MTGQQRETGSLQAYALVALAGLCWSGNHVIGRAIAGHVPPIGISAARWIIPVLILLPMARKHLRPDWPLVRRHWAVILLLGVTGGALFSALQYVGLQYTTAVNVSVLNSLSPVLIVIAGAALFADQLHARQIFGITISLTGVLLIVTRGDPAILGSLSFNRGDLIILFNMGVWALYSACLRLRPPIHWTTFMLLLAAIATAVTLPFAVYEHLAGVRFQPTMLTLSAIAYVSLFPSLVAYVSWNRGVEAIGANRAGAFLHLIPLYSAVLAGLLLGERLHGYHLVGFGLILSGVWLAARKT